MVTNRDSKSFGSRRKKIQKLLRRLAPLTFLIRVQAFRDPLRGELPHSCLVGAYMFQLSCITHTTDALGTRDCHALLIHFIC